MKFYSRLVIAAFVIKMLSVSVAADAAPIATSAISTGCGLVMTDNYTSIGPLPFAVQDSCFVQGQNNVGTYTVSSDVSTGFGPALPRVGVVDAVASASATGTDPSSPAGTPPVGGAAQANGSVTFYFTVEELQPVPGVTFTPTIYFEASGNATLEGTKTNNAFFNYEGSASAVAILPDGTQWSIQGDLYDPQSSWSDQFSQSTILDLAPNDFANPFYEVTIGAGCYVGAWTGGDYTSTAECHATIDPIVRLDQAAFDAKYGANSFLLSDYYSLQFSTNVNAVPVPAAVWLFGSGLLGLVSLVRRKKAA